MLRIVDGIRHAPYGAFSYSEHGAFHDRATALATDDRAFQAKTDPAVMDDLLNELTSLRADIAGRISTD
ncbi:hypothetical protein M2390_000511 [Mycetocola sp. BIGb0189]|uniref:hypothetical protein n=1 Tax=Mycetocola sp. BIGb0189 TaxID=2940604 RepID=UPI00216A09D0|nr:hypothetical protein [Mycetocola sp. BIGb0189]MCS4275350.1 hypothetical protein [Mycetocola sp. BIGb0189]